MKKITLIVSIALFAVLSLASFNTTAQENTTETTEEASNHSFDFGADLMSRYVWRGLLFSASPNIQPWMEYGYKNFAVGAWGSYATNEYYAEVDLYMSYSLGPVSLTLFDYYTQDEAGLFANNYFEMKRTGTGHLLEATLAYTVSDNFPLTATAATFFYGADLDANGDNNYSTYLELAYPFQIVGVDVNAFVGATVNEGMYATKAGFVNLGIQVSKSVPITEKYSLPLTTSLSMNPSAKEVFFVFGVNF